MKAAATRVSQHGVHVREALERLVDHSRQTRRFGNVDRVIDVRPVTNLPFLQQYVRFNVGLEIEQNQRCSSRV
jgi:hypothetical protein